MTNESELRQSIVNVWGEGSPQVNTFDRMLERYVKQISINSHQQTELEELKSKRHIQREKIKFEYKNQIISIIDNVYNPDKDIWKIHTKTIYTIKKEIKKL